ncbi:enoyl-CoA hydratase-related protein [Cupriavidus lacunae]|uniref:Enoyl-CoA hydratase n=1 Tax=Cupriavidus lacunae TaxID=2666307 RepID=A0A370NJI2_9BURK|nr:enoyl-CoA hydratase-related protein [Cupriavidus lacunae]RDK05726.1 enoyl-CoA hydratase [Cupriavidus lacunae]
METTQSASADTLVLQSLDSGVLTLTLNAQESGNALDVAMTDALADALESVNGMSEVHCVLLCSSGKHFCTGGNVRDMQKGTDLMDGGVEQVRERLRTRLHRITRALHDLEVPSIAAVNGPAIGAGCDLALMCDMRLAGTRAVFAESFLRLGLVSGIGGAWYLTRIVGLAKAMELTLSSEFIDAKTAVEIGLASRLVPDYQLEQEARDLARRVAANTPRALRMAKRLVKESAGSSLSAALEMAASMQAILLCGGEHKEAVTRFIERNEAEKAAQAR